MPRHLDLIALAGLLAAVGLSCRHPAPSQPSETKSDRVVEDCVDFIDDGGDGMTSSRVSATGPVAVVDGSELSLEAFYAWQKPYLESAGSRELPDEPEHVVAWAAWYALLDQQLESAGVTVTHGDVDAAMTEITERAPEGDLSSWVDLSEQQLRFAVCRDLELEKLFASQVDGRAPENAVREAVERYGISKQEARNYVRLRAASRQWRDLTVSKTFGKLVDLRAENVTAEDVQSVQANEFRRLGESEIVEGLAWRMHLRDNAWEHRGGTETLDEPVMSSNRPERLSLFSQDIPRAVVFEPGGRAVVVLPQQPATIEATLHGGIWPGLGVRAVDQPWIEPLSTLALRHLSVLAPRTPTVDDRRVSLAVDYRCERGCEGFVAPDQLTFRQVDKDDLGAYLAERQLEPNGESVYLRYCGTCHGTHAGGGPRGPALPNPEHPSDLDAQDMIDIVLLGNSRGPLHERRSPVAFKRGLALTLDDAEVAAVVEYISRDFWNREVAVGPEEVFARECRYDLPPPSVPRDGLTRTDVRRRVREAKQSGSCDEAIRRQLETLVAQPDSELLEQGKAVYERQCTSCHGQKGHGRGAAAYALQPAPTDFRGATDDDYVNGTSLLSLKRSLEEGIQGSSMAAYPNLSEREQWAVTQYVYQWIPEDVRTPVDPERLEVRCRADTKRGELKVDPCAEYGRGEDANR